MRYAENTYMLKLRNFVIIMIHIFFTAACNLQLNITNPNVATPEEPEIPFIVLGKPTASSSGFGGANFYSPSQMIRVGTKLIALDNSNNRVLIWNQTPTTGTTPADVVLGQPTMHSRTSNFGGISNKSLSYPSGITSDGIKLAVSDSSNNRILIWNTIPTSNFKEADVVLGQPDFTTAVANNGGVTGASFSWPYELESANGNLMLADYNNKRVLVWNSFPTTNFASADFALGQANLTASVAATTQTSILGPDQIWSDGTKLIVADYSASRLMIWNSIPVSGTTPADLVLGQANFTSGTANAGGISNARLNSPWGVTSDGTKIVAVDTSNHRLLIWNTWPTTNGQAADVVWGQPNATSNTANQGLAAPTGLTLSSPYQGEIEGGQLFISDGGNNRVLVFNGIPTSASDLPAFAIGQPDLTSFLSSHDPIEQSLMSPYAVSVSGTTTAVADSSYSRVLIWTNSFDGVQQNPQANLVLGQPNFTSIASNNGGRTAKSLSWPTDTQIAEGKVFISDNGNCRIAIWNSIPTASHEDMNVVVGQLNKTTASCTTQQNRLNYPKGLHVANNKLIVVDSSNRILLWNSLPTTDNANADIVLGQTLFTTTTANNGGISAASINVSNHLADVWTDGTRIAFTDSSNHRILLWNSWPVSNKQPADIVLGQPDFSSAVANNGGISAATLNGPTSIYFDGSRLFVADTNNNRILVWNGWPQSNSIPADAVLGQPNYVSLAPQVVPEIDVFSMDFTLGISVTDGWLYRADTNLGRVVGIPLSELLPALTP